jgi:hypothetical protein
MQHAKKKKVGKTDLWFLIFDEIGKRKSPLLWSSPKNGHPVKSKNSGLLLSQE